MTKVPDNPTDEWKFEMYIIGDSQRSTLAMGNLRDLCETYLKGHCTVDVYDVKEHPELLAEKRICAAPTLIKKYPLPEKMMVGDLSFTDKVLECLDINVPRRKPARGDTLTGPGNIYREGLSKQGMSFKFHHAPH